MTKLAYLRDNFDAVALDSTKWTSTGAGVALVDGALRLTPDNAYSTVTSIRRYDLTQSQVVARIDTMGAGETREFTLAAKVDSNAEVSFYQHGNSLTFRLRVGGANNDVSIDIPADGYWRIREADGVAYWDTSEDGIVWTTQRTQAHGLTLTSVQLFLRCGFFGSLTGPTYGGGTYGGGLFGGVSGLPPDVVTILSINGVDIVPSTVPPVVVPSTAPAWVWAVGPWRDDLPSTELVMAGARSLSLHLKDPSEARFTLWGYADEASTVDELITDLWVHRDGEYLYRGRVTSADDALEADSYALSCSCVDYRGVLDRRLLYSDFSLTAQEQSLAVSNFLTHTQDQPGGNLGLTLGTWPVTGVDRTAEFKTGDSIWESIKKLGEMENGFDLEIDHLKVVNLLYPQSGVDNGEVLDFGGVVTRARRIFDPSKFANAIRQSGAEGITASVQAVLGIESAPEGRWDGQYGDPDLRTSDSVAKTAASKLLLTSRLLPTYQLTLAKGVWRGPGHIWLGDYVLAVVKAGRLNEVIKSRVYDIDIDIDANDQETVTVTVGDPRVDVRSFLRGISKQVQVLQKRG